MPDDGGGAAHKGKAVEHLIAASCILASSGKLNALTGLVDDEGVDITFKARGGLRTLDVQVKARFLDGAKVLRDRGRFIANVQKNTFQPRRDLYMLFVAVDGAQATFGPVWLVPSADFDRIALHANPPNGGPRLRFQASARESSQDKWSPYRLRRDELAPAVLGILAKLEAADEP